MANSIKYNTGTEANALRTGNFHMGVGDASKGPTSTTGYYSTVNPPPGGYTIYVHNKNIGPSIQIASNDAQLIRITNTIASTSYTTPSECFQYFNGQTDKMVVNQPFNFMVTDGLVLNVDAGNLSSYPTAGTTWKDLSGEGNDGTLTNGVTFNENGYIEFDGIDDYVGLGNPSELNFTGSMSHEVWFLRNPRGISNLRLTSKGAGGGSVGNQGFSFFGSNTDVTWSVNVGGVRTNLGTPITTGKWYHIVGTVDFDTGIQKVYLNGVEWDSRNLGNTNTMVSNKSFFIGSYYDQSNLLPWDGKIGIVRAYKKSLSLSEIQQNYFQSPIVTDGLAFAVDAGNLVSYESGSTTTYSLTGSDSGTLINGVAYSSNNGGYWDFDGSDDYILTNFGDGLNPTTQDLSYGIWVKPDATQTAMFMMQSNWGGSHRFYVGSISGKLGWGIQGRGWNANDTDLSFVNGEWYYINIIFSGTTVKLYANGVLKATDTISSYVFDNNLGIGSGQPYNSGYPWNGGIAACRVYDKALTAEEVMQNYSAGKGRFSA